MLFVAALAAVLPSAACSDDRDPPVGATTIDTGGVEVRAVERLPTGSGDDDALTVLFLHGQAYTSRIWDDRGILDDVAATGRRAVAVDLPGYGDSPDRPSGPGADPIPDGTWLLGLIGKLGGSDRVVVVSPSMSGRYSLDLLARHPGEPLAGFVPVAPVGTDDLVRPHGAAPIPTLVVYGASDPAHIPERADALLDAIALGTAQPASIELIEGAGHAAYDDDPARFTELLLAFLDQLDPP